MWKYIVGVALVFAAGGYVFERLVDRSAHHERRDRAARALHIVDHDYLMCTLGEVPPPAELGRRALLAQSLGTLRDAKVRDCGVLADQALAAGHLGDTKFHGYVRYPGVQQPAHDLCDHVEEQRTIARTDFQLDAPAPDCDPHLSALDGVTLSMQARVRTRDDAHVLQVVEPGQHYRETRDAITWLEAAPLDGYWPIEMSSTGVFGFDKKPPDPRARYEVLDGTRWHAGALARDGRPIAFRKTTTGWTIVTDDFDNPTVVRLDAMMDHVLGATVLPAMRGAWPPGASEVAIVDASGAACAFAVHGGDMVTLQSQCASVDGKPGAPKTLELRAAVKDPVLVPCQTATTTYLILPDVGTFVTQDGGATLQALAHGDMNTPAALACTDQHLFAATPYAVSACDHAGCRLAAFPLPPQPERVRIAVQAVGKRLRVLAGTRSLVFLFAATADDSPELQLKATWTWDDPSDHVAVHLDDRWLVLRSRYSDGDY